MALQVMDHTTKQLMNTNFDNISQLLIDSEKMTESEIVLDSVKILIVEDDPSISRHLEYMLKNFGHQVFGIVSSGEQLLITIAEEVPDLILMDIELGDQMDGICAARKMKCNYDIPFIYLSAKTDEKTLKRAQVSRPSSYLTKPINPTELKFAIELAIYKHHINNAILLQKKWYKTAITSIGDGILAINSQSLITFANPTAKRKLLTSDNELIGKPFFSIFNLFNSEKIKSIIKPFDIVVQKGMSVHLSNYQIINNNTGFSIPIDCTISPIKDQKNLVCGCMLVFRNISQRLKSEIEKQHLETQLRHSQKMEAIGQLAGQVAHEFNNIITGISSYTELAISQLSSDDATLGYNNVILKKLDQATLLTRKLLSFSRKQDLQFEKINLNKIISSHLLFLQQLLNNEIEIKTKLSNEVECINGDINAIEQILTNLCLNARDALNDYGTIEITTEHIINLPKNVRNYISSAESYIQITVRDNGIGMDSEVCERIFDPFFTTKTADNGTGLGLSIVYGLVKQHKGWISCKSQPGVGTVFRLIFPATNV